MALTLQQGPQPLPSPYLAARVMCHVHRAALHTISVALTLQANTVLCTRAACVAGLGQAVLRAHACSHEVRMSDSCGWLPACVRTSSLTQAGRRPQGTGTHCPCLLNKCPCG
eukprot:1014500-Pelagomonas_calceolata.AAC.5